MPVGRVFKNFSLFVDGGSFAGKVEELALPKLTIKMEEFSAGGMDAPVEVDMGMEKLECEFTLTEYDEKVIGLFGLKEGNDVPLVFRGAMQDQDGTVTPIKVDVRGIWREVDMGSWKKGDKATMKVMVACRYYKMAVNDSVVTEIDLENMVRKINGEDQMEGIRSAIGS